MYRASLLYLPPTWIDNNASKIGTDAATSTGERDYAFLRVTGAVGGTPLPSPLPALPITTDPTSISDHVFAAAYPAQYLGGIAIQKNLYASSAYSSVQELFGFDKKHPAADLVSLSGSVVSQEGSSGGAVTRPQDGALLGIITTESAGTTTADRMLYALTVGYIDRSLKADGQSGILNLLSGDLQKKVDDFAANIAPALTQKLVDVLER